MLIHDSIWINLHIVWSLLYENFRIPKSIELERKYICVCKGNGEVVLADTWFLWGGGKRNVWELDNDGCTTLYLMSLNYTPLSG